ncbi:unnamed protein product [Coregonus sp. 'balchen']|nr:unnamed protein product [Coregonus sp. 'balchen']
MVLQILVPFLLAGLGTVSAGMLLDIVQHWEVFQRVTEIFILMQATVLGLLAALTAVVLGWVLERDMFLSHATLLCSAKYYPYVSYLVCLIFLCLTPLWVVVSSRNPASRILLYTGWEPIITAMYRRTHPGHNCIRPEHGVGGNLVAIQSSRIATDLHRHSSLRQVPEDRRSCYKPCRTFCGSGANHRSAQVLLLLVVPGHLIFLYTIHLMKGGPIGPTPVYITFFLTAALLQVFILLCLADWMVHCLWWTGKDPDSYSIPYLTALGDLLGTAFLALAFFILWLVGV